MKQTVEEAAREAIYKHYNCNGEYPCGERNYCIYCNGHNAAFDCRECGADEFKEEFIAGTEWKAKQSPWISVEERLPIKNNKVLTLNKMKRSGEYFIQENSYEKIINVWKTNSVAHYETIAWMPIPSFDEILEMNKDVLQRMKEK